MSVRVLLAAPDRGTATALRDLLSDDAELAVGAVVTTTAGLLAEVGEREPDVVLLHEALGPAPTPAILRDLLARHPSLAVVLAVREPDAAVLAGAMEAGARGVLELPLAYAETRAGLVGAADWARRLRRGLAEEQGPDGTAPGRMVAVAGAKGGVGTTTLACQLALASVRAGRRTCLVDLDLQAGDVLAGFGAAPARSIADLADVADELDRAGLTGVLFTHPTGLQVLPAPADGERGELVTSGVSRRSLGVLRTMTDAVVVDCGTAVTDGNLGAVEIADEVLLVVTPDVGSLRAAQRLTLLWERLHVRAPRDVRVVLNRASRRTTVQPALARRALGSPLAERTVPDRRRALEQVDTAGTPDGLTDRRLLRAVAGLAGTVGLVAPDRGGRLAGRLRRDEGSSQLEFGLALPAFFALVLGVVQLLLYGAGVVAADRATPAAVDAVRAGSSAEQVDRSVRAGLPEGWRRDARIAVSPREVTVAVRIPAVLPGFSPDWYASARQAVR